MVASFWRALSASCGLLLALACQEEGAAAPGSQGAAGQAAAGPKPEEVARMNREAAEKELNPRGLPVYSGPVGSIRGVVKIRGDEAPLTSELLQKVPAGSCPRAHELYDKLYREGVGRTLADVLVTVTEYQGYLPARSEAVRVEAKGCSFGSRVLAITFGQRIDVVNLDAQGYMPHLVGAPSYALRVAMPGGSPVPLFAPKPGQYLLVDETRDYVRSELFVLSYPTFAVTPLDGSFEITGIPAGNVKVTAYSPALGKIAEQRVDVGAGAPTSVALEIDFSASEFRERLKTATPSAAR